MTTHLISCPRNLSTALMYSFAQRDDTSVLDEPFYAYYLQRSGVDHPGKVEILKSLPHDLDAVFKLIDQKKDRAHMFIKGMAKHLEGVAVDRLAEMTSLFYIRDPKQVIASYAKVIEQPTMEDIGYDQQAQLFNAINTSGGKTVVLDSRDLLTDPEHMLKRTCEALLLPWDERMLRWPKGTRPEDGVWAKHWYANVHNSTGFAKQKSSDRPLPGHCQALYVEALPFYEQMRKHRIQP